MASSSTDEEVSKIIDNKENSIHSAQSGIEANDLAGLLCRFEEATSSSADDLSIPMRSRKNKKDILMKAKSTGSSPAVTPPATPTFPGSTVVKGNYTRLPKSSTLRGTQQVPVMFKVVVPSDIAANTAPTTMGLQMSSFAVLPTGSQFPKSLYLTSSLAQSKTQSKTILSQPQNSSSGLVTLQAIEQAVSTNQLPLPAKSISILSTPVDSKQTSSSLLNFSTTKPVVQEIKTNMPSTNQNAFLRSMLTGQTIAPRIKSTMSSSEILPTSTVGSTSAPALTFICDGKGDEGTFAPKPLSNAGVNFSSEGPEEHPDHDYCMINSNARESFHQQLKNSDIELTYTKFEDASGSLEKGSKVLQDEGPQFAQNVPIKERNSNYGEPSGIESVNEFVFEDGEVFIDADGNDRYSPQPSDFSPSNADNDEEVYSNRVTFCGDNTRKRMPRRYRRCAEFSTSPIREDTGNFYDKIPSYYTALSIPTKPTKTTIFASATKAIGSTDHLDMFSTSEPVDDGHYDKVPAHRRCFTNTTKEVAVDQASSTLQSEERLPSAVAHTQSGHHSSKHSSHSSPVCKSSSPNSRRSFSRYSSYEGDEHHSRSSPRRSRSVSRYSGRSSSSRSSCSTCSYCSTCSGSSRSCSSSRSRSRSRSTDYSRSRSRSRSRGPQRMRKRARRGQRRQEGERSGADNSEHSRWRSRSHCQRRLSHSSGSSRISEKKKAKEEEKVKAMEERRVVYVGKIPDNYTKRQLHQRFECFGEIKEVKVNFREHGDNYGFVTFAYACDAIAAKEGGNNIANALKFDLCFGGRRRFCPDQYADLDGNREIEEEYAPMPKNLSDKLDYAALLKQHSKQRKKPF